MTKFRTNLPQMNGRFFLTDGGIETTMIFHEGFELPYFAAFDLLKSESGTAALKRYYRTYAEIARTRRVGFILESATWRASSDWGKLTGYSAEALAGVNMKAVEMLTEIRDEFETAQTPIVISGCVGPRGDGYDPGEIMTAAEAQSYHSEQINVFARSPADMVSAITITNAEEATGITRAARSHGLPVVIAFTVETDGRLPTGQTLKDAVAEVDGETNFGPAYFMINCAHPDHFQHVLESGESWLNRIRGLRANASRMSHAELDEAEELDDGDPVELGHQCDVIRRKNLQINVLGGCCGTDHRHIDEMSKSGRIAA